jgi:DNA segregation ATPase FtsK/SpoIIIE, S-DNA-T family
MVVDDAFPQRWQHGVGLGDDDRLQAGVVGRRQGVGDQRPPGELRRRLAAAQALSAAAGQHGYDRGGGTGGHLTSLAGPRDGRWGRFRPAEGEIYGSDMAAARTQNKTRKPAAASKNKTAARAGAGGRGSKAPAKPRSSSRRAAAKRPPTRATRSLVASRPALRGIRDLEPHQVDVISLAIVAIGIFLGGVFYAGWGGGTLGHGALSALELLIGRLAYVVPLALVLVGARVLARGTDIAPAVRPLRAGTVCLVLASALALAAGTLGIGPGKTPSSAAWAAATLKPRGGVLGGGEFALAGHLLSSVGADLLAVFLFVAAAILLSGATFASFLNSGRYHAQNAMRRPEAGSATRRAEIRAARLRRDQADLDPEDPDALAYRPQDSEFDPGARIVVPEPDTAEFIVRAASDEEPSLELYEDVNGQRSFATVDGEQPDDPDDVFEHVSLAELAVPREFDAGDPGADEVGEAAASLPNTGPQREVDPSELTPAGRYRGSVLDDPDFVWRRPSTRLLVRSTGEAAKPDTAGQAQTAKALVEALGHFGVEAKVVGQVAGPHITRYEIRLAPGIKVSKVANLKDDLAYALAATDIRILAPIPGKTAVGIEVPNARRRIVHLGDVYQEPPADWSPLTVWLGKDIGGRAIGADLAKMPHLLVAGTTGAGKSACVNAMLSSILLRATPHEVRLVLVDPKQVELNHYESIPHLLTPVITSPRMAANALQNLVKEMEHRYSIMSLARTRSLPELNKVRAGRGEQALPYILCVIDELADLMMVAPADVEDSIIRLAQKARAVGIHLVLATQSPRVDVITGMIKANVPSRIAFAVSSQTDSRVILDQNGAESLLGQGDMLFSPVGTNKLQRIQGAYIDEEQIAELTESWRLQGEPELREELLEEVQGSEDATDPNADDGFDPDEDPLLEEAISLVASMGTASTSMLQRRLRLGYTRAGRVIDMLERRGIISGYEGSKPRQVLITEADVPRILVALAEGGRMQTLHTPAPDLGDEPAFDPPADL